MHVDGQIASVRNTSEGERLYHDSGSMELSRTLAESSPERETVLQWFLSCLSPESRPRFLASLCILLPPLPF